MKKIAIVIPYFGSWPEWIELFLETCRYNSTVEWLFFTDCPVPPNAPKNARFEEMTLKEFEKISSKKTGVNTKVKKAYKVCDFRPAFGEIFREHLREYDFWGWGDIDVMYGDLGNIFTLSNLKKYDVISVRRKRTAGALSIFKNTKKTNKLYRVSPDYEQVFSSDKGYAFDEAGKFKNRSIFSITDAIKNTYENERINYLFWKYAQTDKKIENENKKIYWKNGKMYEGEHGREICLYHFVDRKKDSKFTVPSNVDASEGLSIGKEGIREADPSNSIQRNPFLLTVKKMKDRLRWLKDQMEQN